MIEFDSQKHKYKINGVSVPSVTTILGNGYYYHNEQAMNRGSRIHTLTYMHDKGDLDLEFLKGTEFYNYIYAWIDFKKASGIELLKREHIVGRKKYMCAGTLDVIGIIDGYKWIIDIKSGSVNKKQHQLQVSAYRLLNDDYAVKNIGCVYLKPNGKFNFINYEYIPAEFIKLRNEYKGDL